MVNKRKAVSATVIAILFVSAIAGTVVYFNGIVNQKNSEIADLKSPYLATSLGVTEILYSPPSYDMGNIPYNRHYISGSITNTGKNTAFNAGLHVVAYGADYTLEINMTVPLSDGVAFGTDNATSIGGSGSSLQLGVLDGGQTSTIGINIYHEGIVSIWTVTPVWTNTP